MAARLDLTLVNATLQYGISGPKVKNDGAGKLQARDSADAAFANMQGADGAVDDDFVTFRQFQNSLNGLNWKNVVRVATTSAGTLATDFENGDTIDGVILVTGDRILIKDQASGVENGIYIVAATGAPARASDMAATSAAANDAMFISEGTANADTAWVCTNDSGSDIVGTDALVFVQFSSVTAGITTIALEGGATGANIISSGTGPTALLRGILGESGVLTAAVSGDDVVVSVDALGIDTAKIANDAITEAKIANGSGVMIARRLEFDFNDASPVNVGAQVPSGATVMHSYFNITTAWDIGTTMELGDAGTPGLLIATTQVDPQTTDIYGVDNDEETTADTQFRVTYSGTPAAGAGVAVLQFTI